MEVWRLCELNQSSFRLRLRSFLYKDFAISIAAIHHLSTPARRMDSVRSLIRPLRLTRPNTQTRCARFLIYVWAFEQGENSKRKMGVLAPLQPQGSEPTSEEQDTTATGDEGKDARQDVMVPWVLQPKPVPKIKVAKKTEKKDRGRRTEGARPIPESAAPPHPSEAQPTADAQPRSLQVFHRYYHLFVQGELSALVQDAGRAEGFTVVDSPPLLKGEASGKWLRVIEEGYEKDNWWLEGEVGLY